jgi:transposase InsO family protein
MSGHYTTRWLCEALMVSRSGYYDWLQRRRHPGCRALEEELLRQRIHEEFERSGRTYGSPRIARVIGSVSRKRVARLMRRDNLRARQRSKYRVATTDSRHGGPIAPNLLLETKVQRANQVWVTDATAILTAEGWLYVVALLDLYTQRIVGWAMHHCLDAHMAVEALQMAVAQRRPNASLIVHSDRGSQFASGAFREKLREHKLIASMSRKANCYDNAYMEAFWSSMKYEAVYQRKFATRAEARSAIFEYIESFYNRRRLHSSLGYQSPVQFESQLNQPQLNHINSP